LKLYCIGKTIDFYRFIARGR